MKKIQEIVLTPKLLAEGFWYLGDDEQAQFFEELYNVVEGEGLLSKSDLQWYYMGKKIDKNVKAKKMACAMMVYIFNHATNYLENVPD